MKASQNCINLIKKYEGCRLVAYKCPTGVWTIGYGHTLGVRSHDVISQERAEQFLIQDLEKYENIVNKVDSVYHWTQNEFDALVSFAYNVGNIIGLTGYYKRSKEQISNAIYLYNKANGRTLPGLVKRRKEEHDLFVNIDKSPEDIAREVINGLWGNGKDRTRRLKESGYDPKEIQKLVNKMLKAESQELVNKMFKEK